MKKNQTRIFVVLLANILCVSASNAQNRPNRNDDRRNSQTRQATGFPHVFRSIDGSDNNRSLPELGQSDSEFFRLLSPDYADGIEEPAGGDRPSARAISNAVNAQSGDVPNEIGATDYLWQWGQFLDHDITLTPVIDPEEYFNVAVPLGDPWFDPFFTGTVEIELTRSYYVYDDAGVCQQINEITAWIDASNVYGSDEERAADLRANDGTGRLRVSDGDLLPYNDNGLANAPSEDAGYYIAGDFRANEQVGLLAMHTLFMREHNYWADWLANQQPSASGDEIYNMARAIVGAEIQAITYREFLPLVLGKNALQPYRGYRSDLNPNISNSFATAAYRFGHSMLSTELLRVDANGDTIEAGNLSLADAFFNPGEIAATGIEPVLRGLAAQEAQDLDELVIDDVRNFLFGPPGAGGLDLVSLNIQRGREHGLPSYNEARAGLGLTPATDFSDISSDPVTAANLAEVYESVDQVDLWVGGLAEDDLEGALVGETFHTILVDQFESLRDGDRFWYESYLPNDWVSMVNDQSLAVIIRRNTDIGNELPNNVFLIEETYGAGSNRRSRGDDNHRRRR